MADAQRPYVRRGEVTMLFLIVSLLLLAIVLGTAAYIPWPVTVLIGSLIALWLVVFAGRERRRRHRARKV
ncbi:hypothetical protein [Streptomyces cucumeris]|uniref:hypothetical protein n=1 Tax=Streptomyces cucumeris TaxID=2962890 RepID=UPI003D717815